VETKEERAKVHSLQLKVSDIKASILLLTLLFWEKFFKLFYHIFLFAILSAGFVQGHHNTFAPMHKTSKESFLFFFLLPLSYLIKSFLHIRRKYVSGKVSKKMFFCTKFFFFF